MTHLDLLLPLIFQLETLCRNLPGAFRSLLRDMIFRVRSVASSKFPSFLFQSPKLAREALVLSTEKRKRPKKHSRDKKKYVSSFSCVRFFFFFFFGVWDVCGSRGGGEKHFYYCGRREGGVDL